MVTRIEGPSPSVHTDRSSLAPRRDSATGADASGAAGAAGPVGEPAGFGPMVAGVLARTGEGATGAVLLEIIR